MNSIIKNYSPELFLREEFFDKYFPPFDGSKGCTAPHIRLFIFYNRHHAFVNHKSFPAKIKSCKTIHHQSAALLKKLNTEVLLAHFHYSGFENAFSEFTLHGSNFRFFLFSNLRVTIKHCLLFPRITG